MTDVTSKNNANSQIKNSENESRLVTQSERSHTLPHHPWVIDGNFWGVLS